MRPKVIAHRGASHLAPENTLTAFRLAASLGVDGIEFDTLLTADGHLVVHHEYITRPARRPEKGHPLVYPGAAARPGFRQLEGPPFRRGKDPHLCRGPGGLQHGRDHPGGVQVPSGSQQHHRSGRLCGADPGGGGKFRSGGQDRGHLVQPRHPEPGEKAVSLPAGGGADPQLPGQLPVPSAGPAAGHRAGKRHGSRPARGGGKPPRP